jgi:hypothetical protein
MSYSADLLAAKAPSPQSISDAKLGWRSRIAYGAKILSLVLLISAVPAPTQAGDFTYSTNASSTITVNSFTGTQSVVAVPETITGLPVTEIAPYVFANKFNLKSITIPDGVTTLGQSAFSGCPGLTNATIGHGVTNIGGRAFYFCGSLTSLLLPDGVLSIGDNAFDNCSGLAEFTIPDSVVTVGDFTFQGCHSLTNFTIGRNVTKIGTAMLAGCNGLTTIIVPDGVTTIGDYALGSCTNLTGIYFAGNAPSIGATVFFGATNATVYRLADRSGWSSTFGGLPTALWLRPRLLNPTFSGGQPAAFGFNIDWTNGMTAVVEAATDLDHPLWIPISTNSLSTGSAAFGDPESTNYSDRFYRLRSR